MYKDKYFTVQRCINRFLPRDTSRMRATLTWRVCASFIEALHRHHRLHTVASRSGVMP